MKKSFISIIIPFKSKNAEMLKKCLDSLHHQMSKNFEVLIITEDDIKTEYINHPLFKRIKFIKGIYSKTQARNIGAKKAKGSFLLHIDADYILHQTTLQKITQMIYKSKSKAIIIHETIPSSKSIWQKARLLEREIVLNDLELSAPQLIEKKLFNKIGGFDERIDALDDWALSLKLAKIGIKAYRLPPLASVYEPTNIFKIWAHRFHKGRYYPLLKNIYNNIPQTSIKSRLYFYSVNKNKLLKNPTTAMALFILKIADIFPFYLGTLFPVKQAASTDMYQEAKIAQRFDDENFENNISLYKHFAECEILLSLLINKEEKILELGAGTGRITELLTNNGYRVSPTDISDEMLKHLKKKTHLPRPKLIKQTTLPFKKGAFNHTIAVRVIWHIMNKKKREEFFQEAVRTAKKTIIMDFAMRNKYYNPFFRIIINLINPQFYTQSYYFTEAEIERLASKNNLIIKNRIALEVLPPLWFNAIPKTVAIKIFPYWKKMENALHVYIPSSRLIIQFMHK